MDALKAEQLKSNKWRVLSIPYGGPLTVEAVAKLGIKRPDNDIGFDADGEFFSKNSDIKPDWFDRRPLVWHHNLDQTMKADPVLGTADDLEQEDDGWWTTVWLNRQHRYFDQITNLMSTGKMYGSSGTLPNFAKTDPKSGEILVWPYIEQTLTPTPSNLRSVTVPAYKAVSHFDSAGIGLSPAVRGLLTPDLEGQTADLPDDLPSDGGSGSSGDLSDGGDERAAIQRLQDQLALLERLAKKL